jgi:hypothetical protein
VAREGLVGSCLDCLEAEIGFVYLLDAGAMACHYMCRWERALDYDDGDN